MSVIASRAHARAPPETHILIQRVFDALEAARFGAQDCLRLKPRFGIDSVRILGLHEQLVRTRHLVARVGEGDLRLGSTSGHGLLAQALQPRHLENAHRVREGVGDV